MLSEALKETYRKAFEQETDWGGASPSSARVRHRYRSVIRLIESDMLPLADDDAEFRAELLRDLGHVKGLTADYQGAYDALDRAIGFYSSSGDLDELISCWTDLGNFQRDASDFEAALESYRKVVALSEPQGNRCSETADAYCGLADVHRLRGEFPQALENLTLADRYAEMAPSIDLEGNILWTRAYVLLNQGRFHEAAPCYLRMYDWCRDGTYDDQDKAPALAGLGDLYRMTGRCEEALALYAEADTLMDMQEDRTQRPWVLAVTALAALQLERLPDSRRAAIQADFLARRGDPMSVAWALQARGEMHRIAEEFGEARTAHREALEITRRIGCRFEEAHSLLALAILDNDIPLIAIARDAYAKMESDWGVRTCDRVSQAMTNGRPIPPLNFP